MIKHHEPFKPPNTHQSQALSADPDLSDLAIGDLFTGSRVHHDHQAPVGHHAGLEALPRAHEPPPLFGRRHLGVHQLQASPSCTRLGMVLVLLLETPPGLSFVQRKLRMTSSEDFGVQLGVAALTALSALAKFGTGHRVQALLVVQAGLADANAFGRSVSCTVWVVMGKGRE